MAMAFKITFNTHEIDIIKQALEESVSHKKEYCDGLKCEQDERCGYLQFKVPKELRKTYSQNMARIKYFETILEKIKIEKERHAITP